MLHRIVRQQEFGTTHAVVATSVVEFVAESLTHDKFVFSRDRHVTSIIEFVQIAPEQQPISDQMLTPARVGFDMRRFQYWARVLSGHGACAVVCIAYGKTKQALSKPWTYLNRRSITWSVLRHAINVPVSGPV